MKGREDMERGTKGGGGEGGEGGVFIRGRRLFQIFLSKGGDYSRKYGNTEITRNSSLSKNENMFSKNKTKRKDQEKSEKEIISARVEPQTFDV